MEFQHIDPQEAVEIHEDIQSNFSLGIHWGTFNLSYEVGAFKFVVIILMATLVKVAYSCHTLIPRAIIKCRNP